MAVDSDDGDGDEEEWRYSLSDLEDDADESEGADGDADEEGDGLSAGVAGTLDLDGELEAGDIDPENALFVVVGVLLALALVAGFVLLP